MPDLSYEYDVFLSYASEEREWVAEHLYLPLLRCCTKTEMRNPRIFFDVSDEGIQPGEHWQVAVARGLANSRKIVLVYSKLYFDKPFCRWEMAFAVNIDPTGIRGILCPILKDAAVVPLVMSTIQYISAHQRNWFPRLCKSLDLVNPTESCRMGFRESSEVTAQDLTLPTPTIAILGEAASSSSTPADVFISYAEEDIDVVEEIMEALASRRVATWSYKRDGIPGVSYLEQIAQAIDQCKVVLVVISESSLGSRHVRRELERAYETGKDFIPVLYGIEHAEFQRRDPAWRHILGSIVSLSIPGEGVTSVLPKLVAGLKALGVVPGDPTAQRKDQDH